MAFDVTAGPYTVEVGRGDGPPEVTREVVVSEGRAEVDIELGPLPAGRYLVVRCVDDRGRPVQDIRTFGLRIRTERSGISTSIFTEARPNGEYWLSLEHSRVGREGVTRESIETLELNAHSPSRGEITREVDPKAERVELVFGQSCELTVTVDGALDAGLRASLETRDDEGEWQPNYKRSNVPGDGVVLLRSLAPGPTRVVIRHEHATGGAWLARAEIDLRPGKNEVALTVPESHELVVRTPGLPKEYFELLFDDGSGFERRSYARSGEEERLVFSGLPPGRYRVQRRGRFRARFADYDVPGGEAVFEPLPVGGYEVTELREGSVAERAGLRLHDTLIGVDDVDPNDENFLVQFTSRVCSESGALLIVRRAGRSIELRTEIVDKPDRLMIGLGAKFRAVAR